MAKVKVCGITLKEDALVACASGVDALGFNFYRQSPRYIPPEEASEIIRCLPVTVLPVGIFVDHTAKEINNICRVSGVQVIQLHGEERALDDINKLQCPILKAYRVTPDFNPEIIKTFHMLFGTTTFVIDAFQENLYGGTGKQINSLQAIELNRVISQFGYTFLAGGLNEQNVGEIIRDVRPYGVDVASGIESDPGKKDHQKMAAFIAKAKQSMTHFQGAKA